MNKYVRTGVLFLVFMLIILFVRIEATDLSNRNLIGITYARILCRINGVAYYKGFKDIRARTVEEFNLPAVESKLKSSGLPLNKENIRSIYAMMENTLTSQGIHVVEMRQGEMDTTTGSTVIPIISVNLDIMEVNKESYYVLAYTAVERWNSTWIGDQNVQAPSIGWWQKKMLNSNPKELAQILENTANELMINMVSKIKSATLEPEKKPAPSSTSTSPKAGSSTKPEVKPAVKQVENSSDSVKSKIQNTSNKKITPKTTSKKKTSSKKTKKRKTKPKSTKKKIKKD